MADTAQEEGMRNAEALSQALPYIRRYDKRTVVVKYGGHAMGDVALGPMFARDLVLLKQVGINPVLVHGGGPQIGAMLERLKIKSSFVEGLRVTDAETVDVVEMVLAGSINKGLVALINEQGGTAVGLSGKDGRLITARKLERTKRDPDSNIEKSIDLGYVGEPEKIDPHVLDVIIRSDIIPVIAPTCAGPDGQTYNINADTAAGAIAGAIKACRLLLLTDVAGVKDKSGKLISRMSVSEARAAIAGGVASGGMIPKIETCIAAIEAGVEAAVILDGRVSHAVLLELFTHQGAGTLIEPDKP
jgi:acetylglutamate kinase